MFFFGVGLYNINKSLVFFLFAWVGYMCEKCFCLEDCYYVLDLEFFSFFYCLC